MTLTKYVGILASGLALTGAASAQGNNDAMSEMAQIKAELATLKSQNGDKWLTEERANEIKSLVKDVLADSETRTSLQGSGATSGYNNGFFISSADGNFKLQMNVFEQVRFTWNHQPEDNGGNTPGNPDNEWGVENRRTEMTFSGNVVDPSWNYMVRTNYGSAIDPYTPTAGVVALQDAWVAKDFGNGLGLKVGQFKSPFMAESLRNDGAQLSAERSVVDYYFSGGYVQGLALSYSSDQFRATGSCNNSPRGQNSTWTDGNSSISVASRAEFKASGSWGQFDTESSAKSDESGLLFGAAVQYYNNRGLANNGAPGALLNSVVYNDTTGAIDWTFDATFKSGGMSFSGALVGANYSNVGASTKFNSYGAVFQGGYRFTDSLEAFGRWEWYNVANGATSPDGTLAVDVNNILTIGVNAYMSTNIKWTTQFGLSLSDIGSGAAVGGAGWRPDNNTAASDQFNIISQLQVSF